MSRCALLFPDGLELLPPCVSAQDAVLSEGLRFQAQVGSRANIFWQENSLSWLANPLASALSGARVCGDAVLELSGPFASDKEVGDELISTLKQVIPPSQLLDLLPNMRGLHPGTMQAQGERSWESWSDSEPSVAVASELRGESRSQHSCSTSVQPQIADTLSAKAKAYSSGRRSSGSSQLHRPQVLSATMTSGAMHEFTAEPTSTAPCTFPALQKPAPVSDAPARQHGTVASRQMDTDPRQRLLWSIASHASSNSWFPWDSPIPGASLETAGGKPGLGGATGVSPTLGGAVVDTSTGTGTSMNWSDSCQEGGSSGSTSSASPSTAAIACSSVNDDSCSGSGHSDELEVWRSNEHAAGSSRRELGLVHGLSSMHCNPNLLSWQPWDSLRPEILANVIAQAGHSAELARTTSQVCRGWRLAVLQERGMLRLLRFERLQLVAARAARVGCGFSGWRGGCSTPQDPPWLVLEAARAGSLSAAVVSARHLERESYRCPEGISEAIGLWGKAARRGHPEGQAKLGLAYYNGTMGLACDCEEAIVWLTRAAKQLAQLLASPESQGQGGSRGQHTAHSSTSPPSTTLHSQVGPGANSSVCGSGSISPTAAVQRSRGAACGTDCTLPDEGTAGQLHALLMGRQQCRALLAQVAHILGLLHLDGEGTKADFGTGIRWLKLADSHGCSQAGMVVGSLYNTGQYG